MNVASSAEAGRCTSDMIWKPNHPKPNKVGIPLDLERAIWSGEDGDVSAIGRGLVSKATRNQTKVVPGGSQEAFD